MKLYCIESMAKITAIAISAVTVAACHTGYKPLSHGANPSAEAGAQTYAMQSQKNYQGKTQYDQLGRAINPLVAPANQAYYFDFDSNVVSQSDYKAMAVQANYLATHPKAKVRLEGNTDNRGSREYNIGLGWRRDQAVVRLLEQQGVSPKQIDMVSYGKERPAVLGNNEKAWSLNRRVNLVYEAN